jgi:DNA-binding MarR family transcriptional regulator
MVQATDSPQARSNRETRPLGDSPQRGEPAGRGLAGEQVLVSLWSVIRSLKQRARADGPDPGALHVVHMVEANGPLRLTALAECAGLDASTISRHVRGLEDAGHLVRTSDPDDRRVSRVAVSDSGRALLQEALRRRAQVFDEALAGWPEADRAAFATLLARFAEELA